MIKIVKIILQFFKRKEKEYDGMSSNGLRRLNTAIKETRPFGKFR